MPPQIHKNSLLLGCGWMILLLVQGMAALLAASAVSGQDQRPSAAQRKVRLDLSSATLLEALRALFTRNRIAYSIEPSAAKLAALTPRSVNFIDVPLDLALEQMLHGNKNEFDVHVAGGKYFVTLKKVTLNTRQTTPAKALRQLFDQTASDFVYPEDIAEAPLPALSIQNVPLDAAIRQLFASWNAGHRAPQRIDLSVFGETFLVSSGDRPRLTSETSQRKFTFQFTNTPKRQAMEALLRSAGINYVILADDQKPITLSGQAMPFRSALEQLLKSAYFTYRVEHDIITISRRIEYYLPIPDPHP